MLGESMTIKNFTFTYENIEYYETESKEVAVVTLSVYNKGELLGELVPGKYIYRSYHPVTEVAIRSTFTEDLYVIPLIPIIQDEYGNPIAFDKDGIPTFKVLVNPLVNWIWVGGGVLILGGLIVFWPGRQKSLGINKTKTRRQ